MSCPTGTLRQCDFNQVLVNEVPKFDDVIIEDIRLTDGWMGHISQKTAPMGTPTEITQDRFRSVWANTTKSWRRVPTAGAGCTGNPCDPPSSKIGFGADRLTFYPEEITYETELFCFDQMMHITHAKQHLAQIIDKVLKPNTSNIFSMFARKRGLQWAKYHHMMNSLLTNFTFEWASVDLDGDGVADDEIYFDTSADPAAIFKMVPQALQAQFSRTMREGYAGQNPFKAKLPYIELVTDMDTLWFLDHLGGAQGVGGTPSIAQNWRFTQFDGANEMYWRYGMSGEIGNYLARVDELGLRFNFVEDLGAGAHGGNGNRYRYQIVLPYVNVTTTGAGGAAGIGSDVNTDFDNAQFRISFQWHDRGLEMLVGDGGQLNSEMPFMHRDFAGKWRWLRHDLGQDNCGRAITNKWENKGQFGAWFKYWTRPVHPEFLRVYLHKGELHCIPEVDTCHTDPGYPSQVYTSANTPCPTDC